MDGYMERWTEGQIDEQYGKISDERKKLEKNVNQDYHMNKQRKGLQEHKA